MDPSVDWWCTWWWCWWCGSIISFSSNSISLLFDVPVCTLLLLLLWTSSSILDFFFNFCLLLTLVEDEELDDELDELDELEDVVDIDWIVKSVVDFLFSLIEFWFWAAAAIMRELLLTIKLKLLILKNLELIYFNRKLY